VSLERGIDLMRAERWFDAHEALEDEWREAPAGERDFLQGLVHVTVAWHHASKGNQPGASRQLEKATRRLGPYAPAHRGVDVARVLGQVEAAAARVAEGLLDLLPVRI
jgi:predicted metal-dependent hydrolase